jgi:potassium-transporting ATPase potassium-binding subunit
MAWQGFAQLFLLVAALMVTVGPLGRYMALVYGSRDDASAPGDRVFGPIERRIYRVIGVDARKEQRWNVYAVSLLAFSLVSLLLLYAMQRLQGVLPFNPTDREAVSPMGAFNVAVSFVTNTNWQWYSGEVSMSHLTQMVGLTVQNFVSAAAGMAVAVAIIRGITRTGTRNLGNFWVDLVRTTVRILLPTSIVGAVVLMSQGVVQNLGGFTTATPVDASAQVVAQQIPGGPVASQVMIKQLGSNGGGFFNTNSAHPFENPNGWTNLIETYLIVLLPLAFVVTFGVLVRDRRQAKVLLGVMAILLAGFTSLAIFSEQNGNPRLSSLGVDQSLSITQSGGNLEGKDVRFGPASCGLWAGATSGTSNGSVNCMHDSFTPLGGMAPMVQMMLGEVSPGGVGVGLMGMLIYALLAVFIAGLMVGRTPEYLGKKIGPVEMKLLVLFTLAVPTAILAFAAPSVLLDSTNTFADGAHGLSGVLYNYTSAANNNGSAFASMGTGTDWYTTTQGIAMLIGRFFLIIPALAIAGSLAAKPKMAITAGTFPTHTAQFGGLILGVVLVITGLEYFPALALGPIVEHLSVSGSAAGLPAYVSTLLTRAPGAQS